MKINLYIAGVVWLCILKSTHAQPSILSRSDIQSSLRDATTEESIRRRISESTLGQRDRAVLRLNPGQRNRQIQTTGSRDFDFLDFSELQIQGVAITRATGDGNLNSDNFFTNNTFNAGPDGAAGADGAAFGMIQDETQGSCGFARANEAVCDRTTKFRTPSGHCNNLGDATKTFGMSGTGFGRVRSPKYQDGLQSVRTRTHFTNKTLPDARRVSTAATSLEVRLDQLSFSNQIMQWGQFIAHDLTSISDAEEGIICCPEPIAKLKFNTENPTPAQISEVRAEIQRLRGDVCIPIETSNDPIHGNVCMEQVRSATVTTTSCSPTVRLQQNTATHFCDGSAIYGSNTNTTNRLRAFGGGKLEVQMVTGNELPPKENASCQMQFCPFAAGDPRVDTSPNLITAHTLFIRKHNQIASELSRINPRWNDERVFQESRRIVSAIVQNINFNEWIQYLLDTRLDKYDLRKSSAPGHRDTYDENVDPSLLNELAGAALRFGHTTIIGYINCARRTRLRETFEKPDIIYLDGINECLAGMATDSPSKFDKNFVTDMRDHLFDEPLDIVTLNINRGRDHGFDSYAQYRMHYDFPKITVWDDLRSSHDSATIAMLKSIYTDPRDIELFIGGVSEKKQQNGFIGPLFAEILGDGLKRVRNGDRFYFESPSAGFTAAQVNALKAYRYSNLICDVGGVSSTPTDAFRFVQYNNPALICQGSPQLNLELWKEGDDPDSCSWKIDSRSKCCDKRQTIRRTCIGGDSCRPGVVGCYGSDTVTETCRPTCPSTYRNCDSDTGCLGTCSWRTVKSGTCCSGIRTITRQCTGGVECRLGVSGCSGAATTTQPCKCNSRYDVECNIGCASKNDNCRWQIRSTGECCNGYRAVTKSCVGGSSCRAGQGGCRGVAIISQRCVARCPWYNRNCKCLFDQTHTIPVPR